MVDFKINGIKMYCDYDKNNLRNINEWFAKSLLSRCLDSSTFIESLHNILKRYNKRIEKNEVIFHLIEEIANFYYIDNQSNKAKYVKILREEYITLLADEAGRHKEL